MRWYYDYIDNYSRNCFKILLLLGHDINYSSNGWSCHMQITMALSQLWICIVIGHLISILIWPYKCISSSLLSLSNLIIKPFKVFPFFALDWLTKVVPTLHQTWLHILYIFIFILRIALVSFVYCCMPTLLYPCFFMLLPFLTWTQTTLWI